VSTLQQSFEEQTNELYNEAHKNGYKDSEIITIEAKESAIKLSAAERASIQELYSILDKHPIECVICREISRIARRAEVIFEVRNVLLERNVQLICCQPYMKLLDTDGKMSQAANIMFSLFSAISESEMSIKKERMKEGKLRKKKQGKYVGGYLPLGYDYDRETKDICVDQEKAVVIKKIFDMYVNGGMSTVQIAKEMYHTGELGLKYDVSLHNAVTVVVRILHNRAYIGEQPVDRHNNKKSDNIYEAIVDKQIFESAQTKMKHAWRDTTSKQSKHLYFCKGIIHDKYGNLLGGRSSVASYRYSHKTLENSQYQITISINAVDSLVWHFTKQYVIENGNLDEKQRKEELMSKKEDVLKKADHAEKIIEEKNDEILRINTRIIKGKMKESVGDAMIDALNKEINKLKDDILIYTFEAKRYYDAIHKEAIDINNVTEFKDMFDIIRANVKDVLVEPNGPNRNNRLITITFMNDDFKIIKVNTKNYKAIDAMTDEDIDYVLYKRYEREFEAS